MIWMLPNAGYGRRLFSDCSRYGWLISYLRWRWVPLEPAKAISSTVPLRNSRSNARFHDCRYWAFGSVDSWPYELVTPLMLCRDPGNGFDAVTNSGLVPLTEKVCVMENGKV